ncbi:FAD-dependent oxidoreductase [Pelomonas sp. SE-A7]|uniref:FAD-dependent oxidoreductase n=1 Tax=Pelomonas sp. SE-A7 TaxID=3054953 RepID=UPI00259D1AD8|nr:FAD-dependent oxidoreductase [Pelomonas sp. SE-A7]MDM4765819.1 FAD-dependent oxidoreductase [Pelomonas sp. SE-A7]
MQRRQLLGAAAVVPTLLAPSLATAQPPASVAKVRATPDRLIDLSVCTRPFRPQGPRLEVERRFGKHLVHHYGHGGSGWSLSWGSARAVLPLILAARERRIAVIGCGVIGLTTARVAQQAGLKVRIYAKARPPEVASSGATGMWSPESRICTEAHADAAFVERWEAMARHSFKIHQSLLGLAAAPLEWRDGFVLSDVPFDQPLAPVDDGEPDYPDLQSRIADLHPHGAPLAPGEHPFRVPHVRRFTQLTFNIGHYQRLLLEDFFREGGEIVQREFGSPRELAGLSERCLVNCTGYGARALFGDDSLVPVRGQTARLIPQPEVDYLLLYRGHRLAMVPRRDGLLVQVQRPHDFGNGDVRVDREESAAAVRLLASVYA